MPDKPSELLIVALNDLEKCEADDTYIIKMGDWHLPVFYGYRFHFCEVCFAGSVMAKSLGVSKRDYHNPNMHYKHGKKKTGITDETNKKLIALNDFRVGDLWDGLLNMEINDERLKNIDAHRPMTKYKENPKQFKKDIRELIKYFKKKKL